MQEICLKVKNIQSLDSQSTHHHIFDHRGGSIGSGSDNAWIINDKHNTIKNIQALINFEEGIFGLKPYDKESEIFLNDSFSPLYYAYETQVNIGDCFRIGNLEIEIMTPQAFVQESTKTQTLSDLGDLEPYDKLDHIDIQPKGVEENFNPVQEENIDLLEEHDDILGLTQIQVAPSTPPSIEKDYFVSYKNIQKMICQRVKTLQEQHSLTQPLSFDQNKLKMLELQSRIEHFSLIDDKEILNLTILSLLCESLQHPTLESLHPDFFEKSISEIIEECINGNGTLIKNALLNILALKTKDSEGDS